MPNTIIITAGGSGKRMGTDIPKQFLVIAGKPLIVHTIDAFLRYSESMEIVVVIPSTELTRWKEIAAGFFPGREIKTAIGGPTRFHSVQNGLQVTGASPLIGVHDAVRPFVSSEVIERCYQMAAHFGNAVPAIPVKESIRKTDGENNFPVDRAAYRLIQTPQVFEGSLLKKAFDTDYSEEFTDEASVVEKLGTKIHLVEGNPENIKVTTLEDLQYAEFLMVSNGLI